MSLQFLEVERLQRVEISFVWRCSNSLHPPPIRLDDRKRPWPTIVRIRLQSVKVWIGKFNFHPVTLTCYMKVARQSTATITYSVISLISYRNRTADESAECGRVETRWDREGGECGLTRRHVPNTRPGREEPSRPKGAGVSPDQARRIRERGLRTASASSWGRCPRPWSSSRGRRAGPSRWPRYRA